MNISFSTICPVNAKRYFDNKAYNYLPQAAKDEALKHLGDNLRVQDPMMYPKPCLEITSREIFDKIMAMCTSEGAKTNGGK